MIEAVQPTQYYMKGKSRHLFWPMLILLALYTLNEQISIFLIRLPSVSEWLYKATRIIKFDFVTIVSEMISVGIAVCFLIYGVNTSIKFIRRFLIAISILSFISSLQYIVDSFVIINASNGIPLSLMFTGINVISILYNIAWVLFLVVLMLNNSSGFIMRSACAILALLHAAILILGIINGLPISQEPYNFILFTYLTAFFFGALSFSKMKPPKASPTTAIPEINNI